VETIALCKLLQMPPYGRAKSVQDVHFFPAGFMTGFITGATGLTGLMTGFTTGFITGATGLMAGFTRVLKAGLTITGFTASFLTGLAVTLLSVLILLKPSFALSAFAIALTTFLGGAAVVILGTIGFIGLDMTARGGAGAPILGAGMGLGTGLRITGGAGILRNLRTGAGLPIIGAGIGFLTGLRAAMTLERIDFIGFLVALTTLLAPMIAVLTLPAYFLIAFPAFLAAFIRPLPFH